MAAGKYEALLSRLVSKTNHNELDWRESPSADTFQTSFANYSVTISETEGRRGQIDYVVSLINSEGVVVDNISDTDLDSGSGDTYFFQMLRGLYQAARRRALGVDNALDEILKELDDADDL
jgi:hypothetical protein